MRKALKLIQPTSISELAICLSIIRPAAKHTKQNFENGGKKESYYKKWMKSSGHILFI